MIRITGGKWKGRKIHTPPGAATRPTPSRVREALFNVLGGDLDECVFYDLFAGSGAVGLEALSRGAPRVVFVETSRPALASLRKNIQLLDCAARAECVARVLPQWLAPPLFAPPAPSVFFLDPPYAKNLAALTLQALAELPPDLVRGSTCAAQTEKKLQLESAYGPWRLRKQYPHGDTALWIYEPQ